MSRRLTAIVYDVMGTACCLCRAFAGVPCGPDGSVHVARVRNAFQLGLISYEDETTALNGASRGTAVTS